MVGGAVLTAVSRVVTALSAAIAGAAVSSKAAIPHVAANGKIKRGHSHARHILTKKTNKRKRYLDVDVLVADGDLERVRRMLPYGRD